MRRLCSGMIAAVMCLCMATAVGCGEKPEAEPEEVAVSEVPAESETPSSEEVSEEPSEEAIVYEDIVITSENLVDGVWDMKVIKTDGGENLSPQLAWNEIEGAGGYAVYMLDLSAGHWMHMRYLSSDAALELGEDEKYVGPYPPGGEHEYVMYVIALKEADIELPGFMDNGNYLGMPKLLETMNLTKSGETGNVIGYGELSGTYTKQ